MHFKRLFALISVGILLKSDYSLSISMRDSYSAASTIIIEISNYEIKVCSVTYLDFLHARVIHDGTSNIKVSGKFI